MGSNPFRSTITLQKGPPILRVVPLQRKILIPWWSNYGVRWVHNSSAGNEVLSTFPGRGYTSMSGTSMAAPGIAGDAAFIKSYRPGLTNVGIVKLLGKHVLADRDSIGKTIFRGRPDLPKIFKSLQ